jgi:hypothetical protein
MISATAASSGLSPSRFASRTNSAAASPGVRVSRLIAVASSAVRCRRLVTRIRLPPGSGQQRQHLLAADGVVEHQQQPLAD